MNKGTVLAMAGILIFSAGAYGKDRSSRNKKSQSIKRVAAEGNILRAELDEASGKIRITILTKSWCNSVSARLFPTFSGRASFGPFHYNLDLGARTMKGCIPNIEKEQVVTVDAPNISVEREAHIVIHGEDKTTASVILGGDSYANAGDVRVFDENGNLTSESMVDGMPITSVDPGTAEALEFEATGTK